MTTKRLTSIGSVLAILFLVAMLVGSILNRNPGLSGLTDSDLRSLTEFEALDSRHLLRIAEADEPGERLILYLTFVRKSGHAPLSYVDISFYHTNADGDYEPSVANDEATARLSGSAMTDDHGRVTVKTILPGNYASSSDNRHIHMSVASANPVAYDLHFRQYSTFMFRRFVASSGQHFLADLKRGHDNQLIAFVTIECKLEP